MSTVETQTPQAKLKGTIEFRHPKSIRRTYNYLFFGSIAFWILYNTYFGWNPTPINGAERLLDLVTNAAALLSIIGIVTCEIVEKHMKEGAATLTIEAKEE